MHSHNVKFNRAWIRIKFYLIIAKRVSKLILLYKLKCEYHLWNRRWETHSSVYVGYNYQHRRMYNFNRHPLSPKIQDQWGIYNIVLCIYKTILAVRHTTIALLRIKSKSNTLHLQDLVIELAELCTPIAFLQRLLVSFYRNFRRFRSFRLKKARHDNFCG